MTEKNKKNVKEDIVEIKTEGKTDYVFAIFLIFVGSVLLLNTTGLVEWSVWSLLWRFWPLIIVFAGLNLIFEGSKWVSILLAIFSFVILAVIFLWSAALLNLQNISGKFDMSVPNWFSRVVEQDADVKSSLRISQDKFTDIEKKEIEIDMGIGSLNISNEGSDDHLSLEAEYFESIGEPELQTRVQNDVLGIDLILGRQAGFSFFQSEAPVYLLILGSDEIPTDLVMKIGAGKSDLLLKNYSLNSLKVELGAGDSRNVLSDVSLEELEVDVGVGNLNLELGENVTVSKPVNVKIGTGKLALVMPEGVEYSLKGDLGIGSIKTPEKTFSGLGQEFSEFKSEGYDTAAMKLDITAEVGIGELIIK